ncbi:MAG: single-stranded-DNA-specific exonuclease RecJ [Chloroflexi bacterium]|nr:single-stranded-DNA-specific exonuclease RecJ [Chloroflexota bacterium]
MTIDAELTHTDQPLRGQRAVWRLEPAIPADLRRQLDGWSPMLCHLLYCRGYRSAGEIEAFLSGETISHDPFLLPDMEAAAGRIMRALAGRERVAVYGDFDCDGVTAAAVMVATLQGLGLDPLVFIPTRSDGHGLHPEALASLADEGVQLVIAADCGISAIEEVRVARGMGMDVVVTDHHDARADGSLPDCLTVDPTRHDSEYPCRFLCGVGIAYKLAQALRQRIPGAPDPDDLLDLVALGTVADIVPLRDENRSLVIRGLERLRRTDRMGLRALFRAAGVDPARIDPVTVAFYLAPRINAANRLATPQLAYDLITATDPGAAEQLAAQLGDLNQRRQLLVAEKIEEVVAEIGPPADVAADILAGRRAPLLIVVGDWPAGISGLLASKLVEAYGLPAFVGTASGDGVVSVSARSIPGVHVDEILEGCEAALPGGLFLGYGGHSGAAGFRVGQDKLPAAVELLRQQAIDRVQVDEIGEVLAIDAEVPLARLTLWAARKVRSLAPFGIGFSEPLFLCRGVTLKRLSPIGDGKHARLSLEDGDTCLDGVYFNAPPDFLQLAIGRRLDVVLHLQLNEWNGLAKPEIRLRDWRVSQRDQV